jgi:hypothetical protein
MTDVLARWRQVGLRWVFLGLDGHSEARLRQIGKGATLATNEAAVAAVRGSGWGRRSASPCARRNAAGRRRHRGGGAAARAPLVDFTVETPMVGTRFHDQSAERLTTRDWSLYDMHHAVCRRAAADDFYRR